MSLSNSIKDAIKKKLPAVKTSDSLRSAITAITDANSSACVVYSGDELIGIVTEMDLMGGIADQKDIDSNEVSSIMTVCELISNKAAITPCVQLDEDESTESALGIMHEAGVHHLLVSGKSGNAVGVISALQLLKLVIS